MGWVGKCGGGWGANMQFPGKTYFWTVCIFFPVCSHITHPPTCVPLLSASGYCKGPVQVFPKGNNTKGDTEIHVIHASQLGRPRGGGEGHQSFA